MQQVEAYFPLAECFYACPLSHVGWPCKCGRVILPGLYFWHGCIVSQAAAQLVNINAWRRSDRDWSWHVVTVWWKALWDDVAGVFLLSVEGWQARSGMCVFVCASMSGSLGILLFRVRFSVTLKWNTLKLLIHDCCISQRSDSIVPCTFFLCLVGLLIYLKMQWSVYSGKMSNWWRDIFKFISWV